MTNEALFFPKDIQLETHNYCNLNCVMCARKYMTRPKGKMSDKLLYKLLDEIVVAEECERLFPHHTGEPLLDPRMGNIIKYVKEQRPDIRILLYSNCILLKPSMVHWELDQVICSVDAATAITYRNIKGKDLFDKVLHNIKAFIRERDLYDYKTTVILNFTQQEGNMHEWSEYFNLCNTFINGKLDIIKPVYASNFANTFHDKYLYPQDNAGCSRLPNIHILWDGRVCACCYDYNGEIILGDVNNFSIRDIYNNEKRVKFLESHIKKKFYSICQECNMR